VRRWEYQSREKSKTKVRSFLIDEKEEEECRNELRCQFISQIETEVSGLF
jgi:hypothetical protein